MLHGIHKKSCQIKPLITNYLHGEHPKITAFGSENI